MIVLDTSVVSYIFNYDSRAQYYEERIRGESCVISFQTLEEMRFGAFKGGWGKRRGDEMAVHLEQYQVIWPDPVLVEISAYVRSERERIGRQLATADAWIAATALSLDCSLAAHDGDFLGIPSLRLIKAPR